jgi:hypothetical protein
MQVQLPGTEPETSSHSIYRGGWRLKGKSIPKGNGKKKGQTAAHSPVHAESSNDQKNPKSNDAQDPVSPSQPTPIRSATYRK